MSCRHPLRKFFKSTKALKEHLALVDKIAADMAAPSIQRFFEPLSPMPEPLFWCVGGTAQRKKAKRERKKVKTQKRQMLEKESHNIQHRLEQVAEQIRSQLL